MGIAKYIYAVFFSLALIGAIPACAQDLNLIHITKKSETLYGISKHYSITLEQIISRNAFLQERGLQEGDTLQISVALPEDNSISQDAESAEVPSPNDNPMPQHVPAVELSTEYTAAADLGVFNATFPPNPPTPPFSERVGQALKRDTGTFQIALLLPLFEELHDTLFLGENPEWPAQVNRKSWAGLEFLTAFEFGLNSIIDTPPSIHRGDELVPERPDSTESETSDRARRRFWEFRSDDSEVAQLDSADSNGDIIPSKATVSKSSATQKKINLNVFDGARDTSKIREFASSGMLSGFDAVVGPLYTDCIESLSREEAWVELRDGLWINPLSSNTMLDQISGLSHFVPRAAVLDELMLHYIDVLAKSGRSLTVFYDTDTASNKASIQNRLSNYNHVSWIPIKSETYLASLEAYKTGEKHLVIWSENRPFTTDLITKLNALRSETLYIYGKSALADMGVQLVYLNNLHATYPVRSYLDTAAADHWTPIYAEKTGMPLTPLAMHAIDLARTLIDAASNPLFYPRQWVCRDNEVCENRAGIIVQLTEYTEIPVHLHPRTTLPKARAITPLD